MSETNDLFNQLKGNDAEDDVDTSPKTELDILKDRARLMGIAFSPNIGVESLKQRIQAKLDGESPKEEPKPVVAEKKGSASKYEEMAAKQLKLVRVRITNLNPNKKDLPGEILTVANRVLGAVRKYIPYGEATDNGYHIPWILYQELKNREFQLIKSKKDSRGRVTIETRMAREFAIELLPPLTEVELARLAAAQAAAAGND